MCDSASGDKVMSEHVRPDVDSYSVARERKGGSSSSWGKDTPFTSHRDAVVSSWT